MEGRCSSEPAASARGVSEGGAGLLARSLAVPTESVAAVLQELGVPYEATSEIVIVPPLTITAIPTARSLTIEPLAIAQALNIELVATAAALMVDFGEV